MILHLPQYIVLEHYSCHTSTSSSLHMLTVYGTGASIPKPCIAGLVLVYWFLHIPARTIQFRVSCSSETYPSAQHAHTNPH